MSVVRLARAVLGTAVVGAIAAPALLSATSAPAISLTSHAAKAVVPVQKRAVTAPDVAYPIKSKAVTDLKLFSKRGGTVINAPCNAVVVSSTPGIAHVTSTAAAGPHRVRVVTTSGGIIATYGYLRSAAVTTGQIVAAGQPIGTIGVAGKAKRCSLSYTMIKGVGGSVKINPTTWLNNNVGKPLPQTGLFGNNGFVLASFNTLGAVHTPAGRYPGYAARTPKQVALINAYKADVVGMQEFEAKQRDVFLATAGSTFGIFPTPGAPQTDNSLIWRNSTMEFVSGTTMPIKYFQGRTAQVPVVLLKQRSSGREAYFINVHNPASIKEYGDQSAWRAQDIAIEKAEIVKLRQTGLPVFLLGDFNDRAKAFCPITANKLTISANSIPSMTCAPPPTSDLWIDWVFAAGPARFTSWIKDWVSKDQNISDHPIIVTRAYIGPRGS
ncbi:MAG TPA: endonuclease/exonuclease/phosphatase family protein [Marmoricola sp.]|jgi:endonuclease/exonuclease/phosphatase family metal-dependent hydrolase|nr:endonuclease/exonuclease/phosphatase family protein [Marmoricola sp.]